MMARRPNTDSSSSQSQLARRDTNTPNEPIKQYAVVETRRRIPNSIYTKIGGKREVCLIDTGACVSCCSEDCVRKHRLKIIPTSNNRSLYGADGKPITVTGETDIDIEVNGYHMHARFKVVKNLKHTVIIGIDMLTEHQAKIDVGRGCVYFGDFLVAAPLCDAPSTRISTLKTLVVPPFSEVLVLAKIDSNYKLQTSLIEPISELHHKRLALARCVVSSTDHTTNIRVLNPTSATVYLKRKVEIGTITPIDDAMIDNFENEEPDSVSPSPPTTNTVKTPDQILADLGIKLDKTKMTEQDHEKLSIIFGQKQRRFFELFIRFTWN